MSSRQQWWNYLTDTGGREPVVGLVFVRDYQFDGRPPEEVAVIERAREFEADAVFFEAGRNGKPPVAQAFVFVESSAGNEDRFAETHKKMWSWGGVPLIYRKLPGHLQLFRCAHGPDFVSSSGKIVCNPVRTLKLASAIASDPWWDPEQLRNGTLWDDTKACALLLSSNLAAHAGLVNAVKALADDLNDEGVLPKHLRRKLLILSLLIAYLEQREAFKDGYFSKFLPGATKFFQVLSNGPALVELLDDLERRFNGNVFTLDGGDRERLQASQQLTKFSKLIEAREAPGGQLTMWELYSFKDLPVELISYVYQLFVKDADSSVYTPRFLVRLMLEETLSWERLDRLQERNEVILDPACGSGVFLVESYKRLVLHWRSRNQWKRPDLKTLKGLLERVHGVDLEAGAVELAAFSLCLALCDSLEPEALRSGIRLFPPLAGKTLHQKCFFDAKELQLITRSVGVVVGNPPFGAINTPGGERSYEKYKDTQGVLPDRQVAYLFLHEAMQLLTAGGVVSMLQQYSFLYNQQSVGFRRTFLSSWDVREILDFISVRGLFKKGEADTKVVVVVAEANPPDENRQILHATFRRSGRSEAAQGFDIDYYDLHWVPRKLALENDRVWRTNLIGGGRVLGLVDRLKGIRTIGEYAKEKGWDIGEGFIEGKTGKRVPAKHITGKRYLPSSALLNGKPIREQIEIFEGKLFRSPYTSKRFSPPMLLIHEHMKLGHCLWTEFYLTYSQRIVGLCAPESDLPKLRSLSKWIAEAKPVLQAYLALVSPSMFVQKATALQADDIYSILYPESGKLELSVNEEILLADVVDYYSEFIRLGQGARVMKEKGTAGLGQFTSVFTKQLNAIYRKKPLQALKAQSWPGLICQPFAFGNGKVDWSGAEDLKGKLESLIHEKQGSALQITRIARIYDENFVFLLKPDRLRYWLRSVALRDADETLSDLRAQGF